MEMTEGVSWSDIFMNIQDVGRLNGERINDREKLREVCNDFESLFIKMMLDSMRSSLTDSTLIPENEGISSLKISSILNMPEK